MRIAGVAERIEQQYGTLSMTVIKPEQNTEAAIRAVKASFLRRKLAPAGIWTVETGTLFDGLHLNVLSPQPLHVRLKKSESYSEILRTTARDAAAYIAKRSGMPSRERYGGELWGSFGTFGKVGELFAGEGVPPVVQAAAVEVAISPRRAEPVIAGGVDYRSAAEEAEGWVEGAPVDGRRVWWSKADPTRYTWKPPYPEVSREQRAEVMRRNLKNLYAAVGKVAA